MQPEWLDADFLASDQDLRRLQLRWLRDDIWMRRAVFLLWLGASASAVVALFMREVAFAIGSAVGCGALSWPLVYYFRPPRAPTRSS
jgi:hypothetical protein